MLPTEQYNLPLFASDLEDYERESKIFLNLTSVSLGISEPLFYSGPIPYCAGQDFLAFNSRRKNSQQERSLRFPRADFQMQLPNCSQHQTLSSFNLYSTGQCKCVRLVSKADLEFSTSELIYLLTITNSKFIISSDLYWLWSRGHTVCTICIMYGTEVVYMCI